MEYYSLECSVLLDNLIAETRDPVDLEKAARNFQPYEIKSLLSFLVQNPPEAIVRKMKQDDVFRGEFVVENAADKFSEEKVKEFVEFVCDKTSVAVPPEARPLFARVRLAVEFKMFFEGRTELSDFHGICVAYAKEDESVLRLCASLAAEKSNPLGKFGASMLKTVFTPSAAASDFVPSCNNNESLHSMACGKYASLTDTSSVREFAKKMRSANYIAVSYHQNTVDGKLKCDFLSFRARDRMFHYVPSQSRRFQKEIILALDYVRRKPVFVFRQSLALDYLGKILGWIPSNVVDAYDVAKEIGVRPRIEDMSMAFTGGSFCTRATNFASIKMPSQTALRHIDVMASFIYEFCVHYRRLRDDPEDRDRGRPRHRRDDPRPTADSARSRSQR